MLKGIEGGVGIGMIRKSRLEEWLGGERSVGVLSFLVQDWVWGELLRPYVWSCTERYVGHVSV
jgi:hypothetical protein